MAERLTLTASEAAKVLGISRPTIYQWAREKKVPCVEIDGRRLFPAKAIRHMADYGVLPTSSLQIDIKELARELLIELLRAEQASLTERIRALSGESEIELRGRRMTG